MNSSHAAPSSVPSPLAPDYDPDYQPIQHHISSIMVQELIRSAMASASDDDQYHQSIRKNIRNTVLQEPSMRRPPIASGSDIDQSSKHNVDHTVVQVEMVAGAGQTQSQEGEQEGKQEAAGLKTHGGHQFQTFLRPGVDMEVVPLHAAADAAFASRRESYRNSAGRNNMKLSCVVEEADEPFSHLQHAPAFPPSMSMSSSLPPSVASSLSSSSSTQPILRKGFSEDINGHRHNHNHKTHKKKKKNRSLCSLLLWPWHKLKNGYVSCMISLEGAGDLSGMVQGGSYATHHSYFADVPLSKRDCTNYG